MKTTTSQKLRESLCAVQRVVVKVGTRVLVQASGKPDERRLSALADQLAALRQQGRDVVLVSSGAIGAGIEALGMRSRPKALADLQMAAAVGQSRLMARYDRLFAERGCLVGQVLLTHDDLRHRGRHLNARNTMLNLLRHGIIPVVNENDAVAVDEIRVGDNDTLAALVAMLVDAELLILLTSTNGFKIAGEHGRTHRVAELARVTETELAHCIGKGSQLSTGGMASKLKAAQAVVDVGGAVLIADGRQPDTLVRALRGDDVGTLLGEPGVKEPKRWLPSKKRWIAFFQRVEGALVVDDGAARAIEQHGKSLLPIGVRELEGHFAVGAMVNVKSTDGRAIARGLVEFSRTELEPLIGRRSHELRTQLGEVAGAEVIHRDNMVVFTRQAQHE